MNNFIALLKNYGKNNNIKIYIVGGYVRDKLSDSKKQPKDIDIIVEKDIDKLIEHLKTEGYKIFVVKEDLNIYRAFKGDFEGDLALLKGDSIKEDLEKRDFTINAIALELSENKIIDLCDGRKHLRSKIVQQVNEDSIKDDPVRILRAARFITSYGMHLNIHTEANIRNEGKNLLTSPKERIFNEFMKIIENDKSGNAFNVLDNIMVLNYIFPQVDKLKIVGRCKYHVVDAFIHMNTTYSTFKDLVNNRLDFEFDFKKYLDKKISVYNYEDYLAIAAFVHDIGKGECYKKEGDKVSFIHHDIVGSRICEEKFSQLGFPNDAVELIKNIVEGHMYPLALFSNKLNSFKKSCFKFFSKYKNNVPYILLISYCDLHATRSFLGAEEETEKYREFIINLFKEYELFISFNNRDFLRGDEIKSLLNLQGKEVGEAIEYLHKEFYIKGINKEMAIDLLKSKFVKK